MDILGQDREDYAKWFAAEASSGQVARGGGSKIRQFSIDKLTHLNTVKTEKKRNLR